jgi:hypothetical protein
MPSPSLSCDRRGRPVMLMITARALRTPRASQ